MVENTKYGFFCWANKREYRFLNREIDFKDVNSLPIKFQDLTVSGKNYS